MSEALFIHGDARRLPIDLSQVDCVITDPPYGVEFKGKSTKHTERNGISYSLISDSEEYIQDVIIPVIIGLIETVGRVILTPGIRCANYYPRPSDIGSVFCPSGSGRGPWGFTCHHPIFYYGKDPHWPSGPNSFSSTIAAEYHGHPCEKPLSWMEWLVKKATKPGELVLDPFMGSGTTGVACLKLGRRFIGLDLDRDYLVIAKQRLERPHKPIQRPGKPEHHPLFGGLE